MASTYSDLKVELIATGEQSNSWGSTTNTNLGTALGEAITGSATIDFAGSATKTLTLSDSNASQDARNLRLKITDTGAGSGARTLTLGSGCQISKFYIIDNTLSDAVTVKNTSGTGIVIPANKSKFVFNDGTNVIDALTIAPTVDLTSGVTGALPLANGGTAATSAGDARTNLGLGALAVLNTVGTSQIDEGSIAATSYSSIVISSSSQSISVNISPTGTTNRYFAAVTIFLGGSGYSASSSTQISASFGAVSPSTRTFSGELSSLNSLTYIYSGSITGTTTITGSFSTTNVTSPQGAIYIAVLQSKR